MNQHNNEATARLHRVLSDTDGLTNAELRRALQSEGVDVNVFLKRLSAMAPVERDAARAKCAEAGGSLTDGLKKFVDLITGGDDSLPSGAFARDGQKAPRTPAKPDGDAAQK